MNCFKRFSIPLLLITGLLFTSCPEKDGSKVSSATGTNGTYGEYVPVSYGTTFKENQILETEDGKVSYESMQKYFTPDYTPETPDVIFDDNSDSGYSNSENQKHSDSVVPGLRDLKQYKTQYNTERKEIPAQPVIELSKEEQKESVKTVDGKPVEFRISDWGPYQIVSENENPTFYVSFTQPVKALTALGEPEKTSSVMTIEPAINGVFRWYGTDHLSFEASEPAEPGVTYTIKINKNLKSLSGHKIKGETTFKTKAVPVLIKGIYGGFTKQGEYLYDSSTGAIPPYENRFLVILNYRLKEERIKELLSVRVGGKTAAFSAEGYYDRVEFYTNNSPYYNKEQKITNAFVVTVKDSVPHNTTIQALINNGESTASYKTLQAFSLRYTNSYAEYSQGQYGNPYKFGFSQIPDLKSLVANLSIDANCKITEDNILISGRDVTLYNLPLEAETEYKLTFGTGIKDIYGQSINLSAPETHSFKTRGLPGYVKYLDYGARIMEAQFPHKILYEYQNILEDSYYTINTTSDPLNTSTYWESRNTGYNQAPKDKRHDLDYTVKNTRQFAQIDLEPYLTNGYGWVEFEAHTKVLSKNYWDKSEYVSDYSNHMSIQVTDLGVTARIGLNKAVVMVRSLSTNKPVANAAVTLNSIASGKTDSNGLCVINFTESQVLAVEDISYNSSFQLLVESGDDKVLFYPSSHSSWRDGVSTSSIYSARKPAQRTFMFVDRGLYKPGETVTFRGIDRNQLLGTLKAVETSYSIEVAGAWWDSEPIIDTIYGSTTESGGFYGSFQLPEDVSPGTYFIRYRRSGSDNYQSISFVIANFERLKFESSIKIPDMKYYGGNQISGVLSASYLAGGALSNASYTATWYKSPSYFSPDTPETKGYYFTNEDYDDYRNYWSESDGVLDANGTANVSCTTETISNGRPYNYKVEAYVTDVSNQRIATSASVTVHPTSFYIGVAKAKGIKGYPKKGTELNFPILLVDTDGHILTDDAVKSKVSSISYTLTREEWTLVNEKSVNDSVYTRYELKQITDSEGEIQVEKAKQELTLKPTECGWYTLKISAYDSQKRYVNTSYEFYVTGGRSFWFDSYNAQSLKLTPDQNQYNPGDTAQILLESSLPEGDYLITVEREGIFTEEIKHFDSPANIIEVPIAGNYVPVVYVSVSSYSVRSGAPKHEYGEVDLDKPKAYYGVTPVYVNPDVRTFSVKIETDKSAYKPGEDATVTLTATRGGKPVSGAELTLMAVDRGVLDLINYHVPNPIDYFYNKYSYPLCVRGGDNRGMIMDPVTYSIKNLIGGDSDETKEEERKDFRPTAVFEPALITDQDGKVTCTFKMPDSLTTYRITAVGVKNDYFAIKENEVKVQNPVNIQQVQPRKLRERDTAECGVLITNLQNKGYEISVTADVVSPTKNTAEDEAAGRTTVPGKAFIDGPSKHKVYVAPGESTVVYFDVAAESAGTVELTYTIKSEVLNEKLVSPIKIEKTYVYETVALMGQTDGGKNKAVSTEQIAIPSWAKDARGDVKITLDATRLGMLGSSVNYLFEYPYGCMEQQSARVLPLVLFNEYIDLFDMNSKVADVKKCVTSFTQSWKESQLSNGGFPYWPEGKEANLYVSTCIAQIYGAAKKRGYTDTEIGFDIKALCSYIEKEVKSLDKTEGNEYQRAFACYVLKLNDSKLLDSELASLYSRSEELSLTCEALVGLAYAQAGDIKKANEMAKSIRPYIQPVERSVTISSKSRDRKWHWYEDKISEMALILQLYSTVNPDDQMVDKLLMTLLQSQKRGYWTSTATTAKVLDSIYTYIKMRDLDNTNYTAAVSINKKQVMKENFKGVTDKPKTLNLPFEDKIISSLQKDKAFPVTFEKDGNGYLFYTMLMRYALPDEMQNSRDEGINITYILKDLETGEILNVDNTKDNQLILETGKVYEATVKVSSTRDREYVALRCPIPSGAEILDSTFVTSGSEAMNSSYDGWWSNQSILDNEIQYFWDWFNHGSRTVTYRFRTARRGVYPTPPVQAECMYEEEVFGRGNGYLIQIK